MESIIKTTEQFIKQAFKEDYSGHDWYHLFRVRKLAMKIYKMINRGNPFIIEMAALLHDYYDDKLVDSPKAAKQKLNEFLQSQSIGAEEIRHIFEIIDTISFRGGKEIQLTSIEARIVQDADRLDAIGAIGIARTFAYGGTKGQPMYHPELEVRKNMTLDEYRHGKSSSIHHFYEKLLKLKDMMQTDAGKQLAVERHRYLQNFLTQFFKEWNGEI
jgi:uncharacterized protein